MNRTRFLLTGLSFSLLVVATGCSGSDGGKSDGEAGSTAGGASAIGIPVGGKSPINTVARGGNTARGGSKATSTTGEAGSTNGGSGGNATSSGGSGLGGAQTSQGGSAVNGGSSAKGGSTNSGGTTAKGGSTNSGGTTTAGGSTNSGGTTTAGGSTNSGGTTSTSSTTVASACAPLCGASGCATVPACLPEAYGYGAGENLDICVPPTTEGSNTVCSSGSSCLDGRPGCPVVAKLGSATWDLGPANASGSSTVSFTATVTQLTGTIPATVAGTDCEFSIGVKATAASFTATGSVTPLTTSDPVLGLSFQITTAPTPTATTASTNSSCTFAVAMLPLAADASIKKGILEAMNTRAAKLKCMACRSGDCDEGVACVR